MGAMHPSTGTTAVIKTKVKKQEQLKRRRAVGRKREDDVGFMSDGSESNGGTADESKQTKMLKPILLLVGNITTLHTHTHTYTQTSSLLLSLFTQAMESSANDQQQKFHMEAMDPSIARQRQRRGPRS
jgi:hypothetical protein